ncbi:MAG: TonB-dependent receptor plug domain-containing protein, partial [Flavobacteriales bacterium]|nr:TonB-dependent receptor plug domain-containing protein [Flavobacteriales bacterium]
MKVLLMFMVCSVAICKADKVTVVLSVVDEANTTIPEVAIIINGESEKYKTNDKGRLKLELPNSISYQITVFQFGFEKFDFEIPEGSKNFKKTIRLKSLQKEIKTIKIQAKREEEIFGIAKLKQIDGAAIYAGKKSEVISMDRVNGNKSNGNAREVFSKVTGLNVWESDCAGLQLSIGGRGLSPHRTSNFNTRQNGYDISADALGYPESYYMPPLDAIDRVEFVRGAGALQYGSQFGGLLN